MGKDTLHEVQTLSRAETPLHRNIEAQGPGGQAYDLAPTPRLETPAQDAGSAWALPAFFGCLALGLVAGYLLVIDR